MIRDGVPQEVQVALAPRNNSFKEYESQDILMGGLGNRTKLGAAGERPRARHAVWMFLAFILAIYAKRESWAASTRLRW